MGLLKKITMLPLESSMPMLSGKGPNELASEYVCPFLEQRSKDMVTGQIHKINGVNFKVVGTEPPNGGGACIDTQIVTTGPPVKVCSVADCDATPAKTCRAKGCKLLVCLEHASEVEENLCLCPL